MPRLEMGSIRNAVIPRVGWKTSNSPGALVSGVRQRSQARSCFIMFDAFLRLLKKTCFFFVLVAHLRTSHPIDRAENIDIYNLQGNQPATQSAPSRRYYIVGVQWILELVEGKICWTHDGSWSWLIVSSQLDGWWDRVCEMDNLPTKDRHTSDYLAQTWGQFIHFPRRGGAMFLWCDPCHQAERQETEGIVHRDLGFILRLLVWGFRQTHAIYILHNNLFSISKYAKNICRLLDWVLDICRFVESTWFDHRRSALIPKGKPKQSYLTYQSPGFCWRTKWPKDDSKDTQLKKTNKEIEETEEQLEQVLRPRYTCLGWSWDKDVEKGHLPQQNCQE